MLGLCSTLLVLLVSLSNQDLVNGDEQDYLLENQFYSNDTVYSDVVLSDGCAEATLGDPQYNENQVIPAATWLQTPAVVEIRSGHYQVLGRVVHMSNLKEQLESRPTFFNFQASRASVTFKNRLDILADTVYIKETCALHGIKDLRVFARVIIASLGSKLDVSTPNWNQEYESRVQTGKDGEDGKDGFNGPRVEITTGAIQGTLEVIANGANGHKGQNGGDGAMARPSGKTEDNVKESECEKLGVFKCDKKPLPGKKGEKGPTGDPGGDAGKPGNGGNAGSIIVNYKTISGKVQLKTCRGTGASAAKNGNGGGGGAGGQGGRGRQCFVGNLDFPSCVSHSLAGRAARGPRGDTGQPGSTPSTPGTNGQVFKGKIKYGGLITAARKSYPAQLLYMMFRQAVDALLADINDAKGKAALSFIVFVTRGRGKKARALRKEAKRKLGFLGKKGFDIFGNNKLFAPLQTWRLIKDDVLKIKANAMSFETAYNNIKSSIESHENYQQVVQKLSTAAELQVKTEKERLMESKLIANSEKRLYVKSIEFLEEKMKNIGIELKSTFKETFKKAQFNVNDFLAILQGVSGFVSGAMSKDPGAAIGSAVGVAQDLSGKSCLGSFDWNLAAIRRSLTFGEKYTPLKDSSNLDFDQVDVAAVPEVMQIDLEKNKESLATQLVCFLDVASRPQDVAEFKQLMENFFSAGSGRIDLIAKVIDLDNEIGGYNFDIPLLDETQKTIADIGKPQGTTQAKTLRLSFMDNLLSTYKRLEKSFMMETYKLYKAFNFRTLWMGDDPLAQFQRVAGESAAATGRLNGIVQLTRVLTKIEEFERKAVQCFTVNTHGTGIQKFVFTKANHKAIFQGISKGDTRFSIPISRDCPTCYNTRLLEIYVELLGPSQPTGVPTTVYLQIRHQSACYFKAGDNKIKNYRQALHSYRNIKFDRLAISDEEKCNQAKKDGNRQSSFCVNEGDSRLHPMCTSPLSGRTQDKLLGEEECTSPYGTYELLIPVDKTLSCSDKGIQNKNCKDFDITKFTTMNVWVSYLMWSGGYPKAPNDPICRKHVHRRDIKQSRLTFV